LPPRYLQSSLTECKINFFGEKLNLLEIYELKGHRDLQAFLEEEELDTAGSQNEYVHTKISSLLVLKATM